MSVLVRFFVKQNAYYDSVTLMQISGNLKKIPGVGEALVGLGTELNKEIARNIGLDSPDLEGLLSNDFFITADCESEQDWQEVLDKVEEFLSAEKQSSDTFKPPTLASAVEIMPGLNLAIISIPGQYAFDVARDCLEHDIHVLMFSDNVSIDDELRLKQLAAGKGLLMMGPDCGTAIINNVPLAFANVVRPGNIGIIGASGTGTQEVSSLIDQFGGGVSQVIGTGGRDLKAEIGGIMFSMALDALIRDAATEVIVLISKPPSKEIQSKLLSQAKAGGKPIVVCFIGQDPAAMEDMGLCGSSTLEDAAYKAVELAGGIKPKTLSMAVYNGIAYEAADNLANELAEGLAPSQRYIRGLYTGGTLCFEAMNLLGGKLGKIYSNIPLSAEDALENTGESRGHTFLDFGDDTFTVGRPHPMIDPSLRNERLLEEANDPECAVILLDCVIGYGAHADAAGELARAITKAKESALSDGRQVIFPVSVCGTQGDPQDLDKSRQALEKAGAVVFSGNAQAVCFAGQIISNH